jgi:hypothetical protein
MSGAHGGSIKQYFDATKASETHQDFVEVD